MAAVIGWIIGGVLVLLGLVLVRQFFAKRKAARKLRGIGGPGNLAAASKQAHGAWVVLILALVLIGGGVVMTPII